MVMHTMSALSCAAVVLLVHLLSPASAHVSLTFPPARSPNYDFLDNIRTGGPCGIPPQGDNAPVTRLMQGSSFNVTFHLAYPHRGGLLVNILATNGTPLHMLLNDTWQQTNDSTSFVQEVTLPTGFTCDRCVLQLLRQAAEWAGGYTFWSCADISIVSSNVSVCSCVNGRCDTSGKCVCARGFTGEYCQNQNECEDDADCSSHGSCVDLESVSNPRKQCFCDAGWFGLRCSQVSRLRDANINLTDYTFHRRLSEKLVMYSRILPDEGEIEIALRSTTTGFVAIGWRPEGMAGTCRQNSPGPYRIGANPIWPNTSFHLVLGIPPPPTINNPTAEEGENNNEENNEENNAEEPEEEAEGNALHAMDCTDVVIGAARGGRSRILDYYTRDRSTPRLDEFYGGRQSLTGAVGMEVDGTTIIKFRRRLATSNDRADHPITRSQQHVIWSLGQVFPDYFHNPGSGIEAGTVDNTRFYKPDEIKYHGTRNRGATTANFYDRNTDGSTDICSGRFSTGCQGDQCDYSAVWSVGAGQIRFQLKANTTGWVAVGFSDDRLMANTDVVVGGSTAAGSFVQDRFSTARGVEPRVDQISNIRDVSARQENGIVTITFTRPIVSTDAVDDRSLENCTFFMYGWGGPVSFGAQNRPTIGYHPSTPIVSNERICLPTVAQCPELAEGAATITISLLLILVLSVLVLLVTQ